MCFLHLSLLVLDDQWNGFDVACLSHLTSITFEATLAYYDGPEDDYDPLRWIPGILDTIPRTTAITTVRVEVIVDGELGDRDTMNDIIPPSWKRMEAFVLQANLHVPREIVVSLHPVTVFDRFTCQNLRACLFRMMPDLVERELLTIESKREHCLLLACAHEFVISYGNFSPSLAQCSRPRTVLVIVHSRTSCPAIRRYLRQYWSG